MYRVLVLLVLACLLPPAFADQKVETQKQLEAARADVAQLKKVLDKLQEEKSGVQKQLKSTETEMGELENQVSDLRQELQLSKDELVRLDQKNNKLEGARLEQQRLIAVQARAAYQSGRQEYLKLLLNQQNPEQFSRTLTYYDYLAEARMRQLAGFNEILLQLAETGKQIVQHQEQLQQQKSQLDSRVAQLAALRKERQQALVKLNKDYAARSARIKAREQDRGDSGASSQRGGSRTATPVSHCPSGACSGRGRENRGGALGQFRRELWWAFRAGQEAERQRQLAAARAAPAPAVAEKTVEAPLVSSGASYGGPFAQAKGKLPWPVDGRLVARYGTPRGEDSRTRWDGVLIGAAAGSPVRAVHGGRVVFALVILDHGNGFLTLYGHNQSLLRNAGEIVKAGESIATVGTSGGQNAPALYFAIRQQGRASDPLQWCRIQG
jgi:septal ring factor EnvC (AmiA/AmiB activator)